MMAAMITVIKIMAKMTVVMVMKNNVGDTDFKMTMAITQQQELSNISQIEA